MARPHQREVQDSYLRATSLILSLRTWRSNVQVVRLFGQGLSRAERGTTLPRYRMRRIGRSVGRQAKKRRRRKKRKSK